MFLGGVITEWVSWPWVFYINIPIALAVLAATPGLMPGAQAKRGSVDIPGAIAVTAGLALAVLGIVRAPEQGWGSTSTILVLASAVALLAAFVAIQGARRQPLMRLGIFRTPNLGAANLAQLLLGGAWIPMWFFLNLYLQQVLGYSAFPSGAALLPMTLLIMIGMIALAPAAITRFGPKAMIVTGLATLAIGLVSSRGESHPPALLEPYVTVSRHTAPAVRPEWRAMRCQWAKSVGSRWRTPLIQAQAFSGLPRSRLNLCIAHR